MLVAGGPRAELSHHDRSREQSLVARLRRNDGPRLVLAEALGLYSAVERERLCPGPLAARGQANLCACRVYVGAQTVSVPGDHRSSLVALSAYAGARLGLARPASASR